MRKLLSLLLAGTMVLSLGACSGGGTETTEAAAETTAAATEAQEAEAEETEAEAAAEGESLGRLLFLQTHNNNSFMSYMGEMFVKLAEERGFEVDHLTADSDEATQLSQIEQGIVSGNYVGIVCDCTGEGVTQGFKEAKEAGLYVMTLHEGVTDNSNVDCVVACSLADTGYEAIRLEVEELGEDFNLAIVNGSEGHGATVAIREGYDRALEEFTDINVVFD